MATEENTFRTYTQTQGEKYASGRPGYSSDLFEVIINHHTSTGGRLDTILDAGCGTGQATRDLAQYFANAIGLDPSEGMISAARASAKSSTSPIRFDVSAAEVLGTDIEPPIVDGSVDLLTAATAAHWFDMQRFWASAARVLKPGGTVALWARTALSIDPAKTPNGTKIKAVLDEVYRELEPFNRLGSILTRDLYIDLPLPWTLESPVEGFDKPSLVRKEWNRNREYKEGEGNLGLGAEVTAEGLEELMGTNSSVTRWREAHPDKVGTDDDLLRAMRTRVEDLLAEGDVRSNEKTLDFSDLELICPINADDISNRWLQSFIPVPGQKTKEYPATITAFIYRILKSYASMAIRGRGVPPFVHSSQTTTAAAQPPLSTCLGLVRMCENPLPGSESAAIDVLQREMSSIYGQHGSYDNLTLLSAFQAYLIYSLVLFFMLSPGGNPFLRQAMMNLQELACASSRQGLVCKAEQLRARPKWEGWIIAEAKRRTLFTMYIFDSVLLAEDGLPTFLGTELRGLLAPASRSLWSVNRRDEWEAAYNIHLTDWGGGGLRIDELWAMETTMDEHSIKERRNRVDRWLEGVDEYGTMIYAVTSCTHGGG
ncbi:uncharacterized protein DNG_09219 [Cephalotrichum gorgonifer]|uniref:Methyltransferase type 11 domain-containing protein n=1 Tax=Cephalotrichum gorgonifer TaxID=2041049 RepID=A0AAE8N6V9_9PEZI|nr:uncharacterized protein DNG_09219 [Cephalotrichum gorgonifer]